MSDLDLRDLRAFVLVAELGNNAEAARRLGMQPHDLRRKVRRVEAYFGRGKLFWSPAGKLELTVVGEEMRARVREALHLLDSKGNLTVGQRTLFRVGFTAVACKLVSRAACRMGETTTFQMREMYSPDLRLALRRGDIDVAVAFDLTGDRQADLKEVRQTQLLRQRLCLVLPASRVSGNQQKPRELLAGLQLACIAESLTHSYYEETQSWMKRHEISVAPHRTIHARNAGEITANVSTGKFSGFCQKYVMSGWLPMLSSSHSMTSSTRHICTRFISTAAMWTRSWRACAT